MLKRNLPLVMTIVVFIGGYLYCLSQYPGFASTRVLGDLLTDNAFLGIVAVGMTFVILSGGIDLSVGSTIAFTGVLLAKMIGEYGVPPGLAFVIVLVLGALYGALTGWIIDALRLPAFIITLASMFFLRGMSFILSRESVPIIHPWYDLLANYAWRLPGGGRLTLLALIMLLVAAGMVLAHRTRFGHYVYAMGGNGYSAALMGVPVKSMTVRIYMLSSSLAVLSGIVFSLYTSAGYALAASGGTLLTGGVGTLFGVLIQGLIQTYITFDGTLSSWWTKIVIGILLFGFIGLQKGLNAFWLARRGNGTAVAVRPAPMSATAPLGASHREPL